MQQHSSAERSRLRRGAGLRADHLKLYHKCLGEFFSEIAQLQEDDRSTGLGSRVFVYGKGYLHLHFEISFIIGDTEGHDLLCCHYAGYSQRTARPVRTCDVLWDNLDSTESQCNFVTMNSIVDVIDTCIHYIENNTRGNIIDMRSRAQAISQHLQIPIFHKLSFGGNVHGIFSATPFETLHTHLLGVVQYVVSCLYTYKVPHSNGDGYISRFNSVEFERRIRILSLASKRQSDRNMPRSSFNVGVVSLSGIQGEEYIGLSLLSILALPGILQDPTAERKFAKLLWLGISLHACFTHRSITKEDINNGILDTKINHYIELFVATCGPQRDIVSPRIGCKLQKVHGLTHFSRQIIAYGSPENFDGTSLESHLKTFVKYPAKTTRKTHAEFSHDLINRWSQHTCVNQYINNCEHIPSLEDMLQEGDQSSTVIYPRGSFQGLGDDDSLVKLSKVVFYYCLYGNNRTWHTVVGRNRERGIHHPFFPLQESQKRALSNFLNQELYPLGIKKVYCHYQIRILGPPTPGSPNSNRPETKLTLRCNPLYRLYEWFDWVNVDFLVGSQVSTIPSRLYMLLSHDCTDTREPNHTSIYALVHSLKSNILPSYSDLNCWESDELYSTAKVVSLQQSVSGPTCVLPCISRRNQNSLTENLMSNTHYAVIPPMEDWSSIGWEDVIEV